MHTKYEVRAGTYYDSIVLMRLQKSLSELPGVIDAGVVMATEANRDVLRSADLPIDDVAANADDLVIIVKADREQDASDALGQVDVLLQLRTESRDSGGFRPKSLKSAAGMATSAEWVLISVNGRYAADLADEALDLGKHVFLYSDNVPLADEIRLKQKARENNLLVMGPDCGTAIVNGIGLGFANRVRRGRIGVVGASGTGIQFITSRLHQLGAGISHAIGTGGRDLKDAVGGITMLQGIELLAQDEQTACIIIVSKPPSPSVARQIIAAANRIAKPIVINFIGYAAPAEALRNIYFAQSLGDAADKAIAYVDVLPDDLENVVACSGNLRGLFSGGTLAYEAVMVAQALLPSVYSNLGAGSAEMLTDVMTSQGHTIIDMGEDAFTQGRLHPMMDNDLRIRRMKQEAADPDCGLIVLDVVLGEGSHPDPAGELVPIVADIQESRPDIAFLVILVGTDDDPQDMADQRARFAATGAHISHDVRHAMTLAAAMLNSSSLADALPTQTVAIKPAFFRNQHWIGILPRQLD